MYSNILHATDLFENHYTMCEQAAQIAKYFNATLFLLHVIEQPVSVQVAQSLGFAEVDVPTKENAKTVMSLLGEALNIPKAQQFVEVGSIHTHVMQKAKELDCTLIIIGNHMQTKLPSFLESSAQEIIHQNQYDVLILR